jgi:hypothetical protein
VPCCLLGSSDFPTSQPCRPKPIQCQTTEAALAGPGNVLRPVAVTITDTRHSGSLHCSLSTPDWSNCPTATSHLSSLLCKLRAELLSASELCWIALPHHLGAVRGMAVLSLLPLLAIAIDELLGIERHQWPFRGSGPTSATSALSVDSSPRKAKESKGKK